MNCAWQRRCVAQTMTCPCARMHTERQAGRPDATLANPALNLQVEASNAAAPELAGVVVPHTASIQMHAAQNQIFGLFLALNGQFSSRLPACREFLDA